MVLLNITMYALLRLMSVSNVLPKFEQRWDDEPALTTKIILMHRLAVSGKKRKRTNGGAP